MEPPEGGEPGGPAEMRKNYPLRKRLRSPSKPKACKVLLTRLEHEAPDWAGDQPPTPPGSPPGPPPRPRKRRLASLNAEALNNLLLEREDGGPAGVAAGPVPSPAPDAASPASAARRCRRREAKPARPKPGVVGAGAGAGPGASPEKPGPKARSRARVDGVPAPEEPPEDGARPEGGDPAPKRLASLNAAAFLKLSQERELPLRTPRDPPGPQVAQGPPRGRAASSCGPTPAPARPPAGRDPPGGPRRPAAPPSPAARLLGAADPPPGLESLSPAVPGPGPLCHRLPLLMGGQAAMKPEYGRPGEKSPTPKQEPHQPSFPVPQLAPLPVPGHHADCGCQCQGPQLTALGGFYVYYGQAGLQYGGGPGGYSPCPSVPDSQLAPACEGLLVAPGSVPSAAPFQSPPWCPTRYRCGEGPGVNSYSRLCGVLPLARLGGLPGARGGCPYKMPFAAEGCRSLDQLDLTLPVAGHPASPAHPLSGCPVPSVPPAAEPVPHLQTPNSEPQTMARECPQSAKPPSGSKSGLRPAPGCLHPSDSKAASGHGHPKQQRIQRRRATNGWMPVGTACEKAVYVVNEPEPAVRKSYQAVEREGEMIRVRDTVLLKSGPRKKSMPYVAKISALWEDPKTGELMMSLLWYYRPEHTQGGRNPSMHQNEIFASRHQDENSVACIEEKCYVLTFAEYCRFCALAKRRGEGLPGRRAALVPPSAEYSTPPHRTVPEDTDPDLVFLCRHVYDFRHGRILKNPQ
ncbi:bromo adjacent homology domain-containing 1 protein [Tachyglossus aculeatus]|uniref:bromo adjacent homology domain-containing 1 protein n=1 Tax=Tachyglossus aculeatus TaxID=9261 RepID=UPI0018F5A306|nr:bromo adjacent homology domain-containing 1 protein [Tachyglossus aculeatus]